MSSEVPGGLLDERAETSSHGPGEDLPDGVTADEATGDLLDGTGFVVVCCRACGGVLTPEALPVHVVQAHLAHLAHLVHPERGQADAG